MQNNVEQNHSSEVKLSWSKPVLVEMDTSVTANGGSASTDTSTTRS